MPPGSRPSCPELGTAHTTSIDLFACLGRQILGSLIGHLALFWSLKRQLSFCCCCWVLFLGLASVWDTAAFLSLLLLGSFLIFIRNFYIGSVPTWISDIGDFSRVLLQLFGLFPGLAAFPGAVTVTVGSCLGSYFGLGLLGWV